VAVVHGQEGAARQPGRARVELEAAAAAAAWRAAVGGVLARSGWDAAPSAPIARQCVRISFIRTRISCASSMYGHLCTHVRATDERKRQRARTRAPTSGRSVLEAVGRFSSPPHARKLGRRWRADENAPARHVRHAALHPGVSDLLRMDLFDGGRERRQESSGGSRVPNYRRFGSDLPVGLQHAPHFERLWNARFQPAARSSDPLDCSSVTFPWRNICAVT
jgi:hypothetical protein